VLQAWSTLQLMNVSYAASHAHRVLPEYLFDRAAGMQTEAWQRGPI